MPRPLQFTTWISPKGENRVYLNGLSAPVFWVEGETYPRTYNGEGHVLDEWKARFPEVCTYSDALAMTRQPTQPTPMQDPRSILESALIVHLVPAARMAGLQFRNGLQKSEIIDRLVSQGLAQATVQALEALKRGEKAPSQPRNLSDLIDLDETGPIKFVPAREPTPTPNAPPADLSAYVNRAEWANGRKMDSIAHTARIADMVQPLRVELEALKALRPLEMHFPELPAPVKVEGLAHPQFPDLLLSLRAGLHCMLVGPAGSGKTHSAEQASNALGRKFHMQGAISYAHELLGYIDAHSRYVRTQFRDAFEHGGLILLDEFDASAAEAALVLNAALANGACSFPDGLIRKHKDFLCVIGANTDGSGATMQYAGRARLDGAFLDRFVVFRWTIDTRIEESLSRGNSRWLAAVQAVRAFAEKRGILDVVATPRATQRGALLDSQGMDRGLILERTCMRGALVECWRDVLALPAVAAFLKG